MDNSDFRNIYMRQPCQRLTDVGHDSFVAVLVDGSQERLKSIDLQACYYMGLGVAQALQDEVRRYLRRERIFDARATMLIYYYADLQKFAPGFQGSNRTDRERRLYQFQVGFEAGLPNGQAILAHLDTSSQIGKSYLEALIKLIVSDDRCSHLILAGIPMEDCVRIRSVPAFTFNQQAKLRVAYFPRTLAGAALESFTHNKSFLDVTQDVQPPAARPHSTTSQSMPESSLARPLVTPIASHIPQVSGREGQFAVAPPALKQHNAGNPQLNTAMAMQAPMAGSNRAEPFPDPKTTYRENRRANARLSLLSQDAMAPPHLRPVRQEAPFIAFPPPVVLRDPFGRRVDPPLNVSQPLLEKMEGMRLCNNFHLKGKKACPFKSCKHRHFVTDAITRLPRELTYEEKETLRAIARRSPCRYLTSCNDPMCYAGHRCPNHLRKPVGKVCSFPAALHFEETPAAHVPLMGPML